MISNTEFPLISVGMPTFNRAQGLQRALENITSQTYSNIEIIISDNCSPNEETEAVVREFMLNDSRISFYKQSRNLGSWKNFQFVLEKSRGEYFMWAADDDEWERDFIAQCFDNISGISSVMCEFETIFRIQNTSVKNPMPRLGYSGSPYNDIQEFLQCMQPSLIYGLHRRTDIQFVLSEEVFDFYDCYFVVRVLLGSGMKTIPGISYRAGIDDLEYKVKPMGREGRLNYIPFMSNVLNIVWTSKKLDFFQKSNISFLFLKVISGSLTQHKKYNSKFVNFFIEVKDFVISGLAYLRQACKKIMTR